MADEKHVYMIYLDGVVIRKIVNIQSKATYFNESMYNSENIVEFTKM